MSDNCVSATSFEDILGIKFANHALLTQALTHRSFVNEYDGDTRVLDNERLEFLGDAVLDLIVADMLYRKYPHVSEGDLTQLRASLVKTESLAHIGARFQLGEHLRIGHGEEISGGRERLTILCRAFEAVIGAVYLDRGMEIATDLVVPPMLELLDHVIEHDLHRDARSELQERVQARLNVTPSYRVAGADGPEHAKEFLVEVSIGNAIIGSGVGSSIRSAAQDAARTALQEINVSGLPDAIESPDA